MKYVNYNYLIQEEIATIIITELVDKLPVEQLAKQILELIDEE